MTNSQRHWDCLKAGDDTDQKALGLLINRVWNTKAKT
jgi:hypothetical protein